MLAMHASTEEMCMEKADGKEKTWWTI